MIAESTHTAHRANRAPRYWVWAWVDRVAFVAFEVIPIKFDLHRIVIVIISVLDDKLDLLSRYCASLLFEDVLHFICRLLFLVVVCSRDRCFFALGSSARSSSNQPGTVVDRDIHLLSFGILG